MVRRALLLLCLPLCACDCGSDTTPGTTDGGNQGDMFVATDAPSGTDARPANDAPAMDAPANVDMTTAPDMQPTDSGPLDPDSRVAFCMGTGPVVLVGDTMATDADVCAGEIAATSFRFAMCTCEDVVLNHRFRTDSFDSRTAPYDPMNPQLAGSVGVNGRFEVHEEPTIGGSLIVAGNAVNLLNPTVIARDLRTNGRIDASATNLTVRRDIFVADDMLARNLTVTRDVHIPMGKNITIGQAQMIGGMTVREPVSIPPPCDCATDKQLDVAEIVRAQATRNDNTEIGLDAMGFMNTSAPTTLDLPCGRFYISQIGSNEQFTIRVTARTALFIGGQFRSSGRIRIDMATPQAELDLFVAGDMIASERIEVVGNPEPRRVRFYFGGNTINLSATGSFIGNIYGPKSELVATSELEIFGSIFVRRVNASSRMTIHYDSGILRAADSCPGMTMTPMMPVPPTRSCDTCRDCANNACGSNGMCGACTQNSDCCAPLICFMGACYPDLI